MKKCVWREWLEKSIVCYLQSTEHQAQFIEFFFYTVEHLVAK